MCVNVCMYVSNCIQGNSFATQYVRICERCVSLFMHIEHLFVSIKLVSRDSFLGAMQCSLGLSTVVSMSWTSSSKLVPKTFEHIVLACVHAFVDLVTATICEQMLALTPFSVYSKATISSRMFGVASSD